MSPKSIIPNAPCQRMSPRHARFGVDLGRLLSPYDMCWPGGLPADWMQGAPIAAGDFGAVVHGYPDSLTFTLGKTDVWHRHEHEGDAVPADFAAFRRTYFDKDEAAFERMAAEIPRRFPPDRKPPHMTTCGRIRLGLDEGLGPRNPQTRLSLEDAALRMTYTNRSVTALVSRAYDVLCVEIDRGQPIPTGYEFSDQIPPGQIPIEVSRAPAECGKAMRFRREGEMLLATQDLGVGGHYTIGVCFTGFDRLQGKNVSGRFCGTLAGPRSRVVCMLVTIVSSRDASDTAVLCRRRLARARAAGAKKIAAAHRKWWREFWMRGLASVGDAKIEKAYFRSLYLCGSILRPLKQSPGLQGPWIGENQPGWNGDYHGDGNMQAVYHGMFANNRLDLIEPYLRLYHGMAPQGRKFAREYLKMRGLRLPVAGSIAGHEYINRWWVTCAVDPAASAWLAQYFWMYYQYTLDRDFLRRVGYPILRDVADLFCDYLRAGPDGKYVAVPSVHYEGGCPGFNAWGSNSLYSNALFRMGLAMAIQASEVLAVDSRSREQWRRRLDNMAEPPMTKEGLFKDWSDRPAAYSDIMFPHVYPADLVSRFHGPQKWRKATMATWALCKRAGGPVAARIGDIDAALAQARWPDFVNENGFVFFRDWGIVQVDSMPGKNAALAEMLLMAVDGVIRLFAGIPAAMPARFLSLRAPGGFLLTAEKRGRRVDYILVQPTAATALRLANPWKQAVVTDLSSGRRVCSAGDRILECDLKRGRQYLIAPLAFDLSKLPMVDFTGAQPFQAVVSPD